MSNDEKSGASKISSESSLKAPLSPSKSILDPGARLRAKRQDQQYTLDYIATQLYLPSKTIEAIEANRFVDNQLDVYTRGYIKAYCNVLEIEPNEIFKALDDMGVEAVYDQTRTALIEPKKKPEAKELISKPALISLIGLLSIAFLWQELNVQFSKPSTINLVKQNNPLNLAHIEKWVAVKRQQLLLSPTHRSPNITESIQTSPSLAPKASSDQSTTSSTIPSPIDNEYVMPSRPYLKAIPSLIDNHTSESSRG